MLIKISFQDTEDAMAHINNNQLTDTEMTICII